MKKIEIKVSEKQLEIVRELLGLSDDNDMSNEECIELFITENIGCDINGEEF